MSIIAKVMTVAALMFAPLAARAACSIPPVATAGVTGFQEAVISVGDLEAAISVWRDIGQYEVACTGQVSAEMTAFWNQPSGTRIDEAVLRKPGFTRGFIRLVKFNGVPQRQIRSSGMFWDTGGIVDLYMYVNDVNAVFAALRARGWQAYTDPVTYTLTSTVTEIMIRGPNGEVLCLMQRAAPYDRSIYGLKEGDPLGFGVPFNAALMVNDFDINARLFADILGWKNHFSGSTSSASPGDNPLGLPKNIAVAYKRQYAAFANNPTDRTGSIQVMQNVGLEGRDFSGLADPPNFGNLALRVPVANLASFAADFRRKGGTIAMPAHRIDLPPYGPVDMLAIKAPNGARIEFFAKR